jgi:hypothetical protein
MGSIGGFVFGPQRVHPGGILLRKSIGFSSSAIWILGCTAASTSTSSPPSPRPEISVSAVNPTVTPVSGSWDFTYAAGILTYEISRNATITNATDSTGSHEVSSNRTRETFHVQPEDSVIRVVASVDSFVTTTTQGLTGPVQNAQVPVQLSASVADGNLTIDDTSSTAGCNPVQSVLKADLNNLLLALPTHVSSGMTWRDSVSVNGCQGGLPGAAAIIRNFRIAGQIDLDGNPVLLVERQDSLTAHGQGAQQQHQVSFDARGTGRARYLLDFRAGRIVRVTTDQSLAIAITSSGRVSDFTQLSQQEFRLLP